MRYFLGLAIVLFTSPVHGAGPDSEPKTRPAESLLSANSAAYIRYDGYEPHKKAYETTALGQAMKEDLGEFLDYLTFFTTENLTPYIPENKPGDTQILTASWRPLVDFLWQHGLTAGVEVIRLPAGDGTLSFFGVPVRLRLTLVFPEGAIGKNRDILLPFLSILGGDQKMQVGRRIIYVRAGGDYYANWWQEGRHFVMVLGTSDIAEPLAVADGRRPNLLGSRLFQGVAGFKDYETDIHGFVDVRRIVDLLRRPGLNGSKLGMAQDWLTRALLLNQLGLTSVQSLAFHLGFDRQYQRRTVVAEIAEPAQRAGLARLISGPVHFDPDKLPPLPPDAASVRIGHVDWKVIHDMIQTVNGLLRLQELFANGPAPRDKKTEPGIDIAKELLAHLDSTMVLYNSFSEGPYFLGQGLAIKVKDEKKLEEGLDKVLKELTTVIGGVVLKQTYRGVDMTVYDLPMPQVPLAPAFAIHKGWLVIGTFPQSVKGYIVRCEGKHKVWQAPALVAEVLTLAKKKAGPHRKLAAITVTDPRPGMALGLSLLPMLSRFVNAAGLAFDTSKVPNAQVLTEWQFPGVTVFFDDGHALRWESHTAFEVPGDWLFWSLTYAGIGF